MSNLEIKINTSDLLDYSASLKSSLGKKTLIKLIESFSYYVKEIYYNMILEAISSRRYRGDWEPVSDEGYLEYIGTSPTIPITQLIDDALEVKKIGKDFRVRFNPRYKYPGSKLPLLKVLRAIDKGTTKFNARPLFSRILKDITPNILSLWKGYLKMKNII